MEVRQLRYFSVLAVEGNYLAAAEELFVSQSQLSKKILALEEELGVQLIDRSRRKIALTPEGELVLVHARQMLAVHEALVREVDERRGVPPAPVSLLSIPVLAPYGIPALLARFQAANPGTLVNVTETEPNSVLAGLASGNAELGLLREPFVDKAKFRFWGLEEDEVVVVVPAGGRWSVQEAALDLAVLRSEGFVFPDPRTLLHGYYRDLCLRHGFEPRIVQTSTREDNILEMVASGMGVALMMKRVAHYGKAEAVRVLALQSPVRSRLGVVWAKSAVLSRGAQAFLAFLKTYSKLE